MDPLFSAVFMRHRHNLNSIQNAFTQTNGDLGYIIQACQQVKKLDKLIKHHVQGALAKHCHVVNFQNNTLLLSVDSNVWAGKFRLIQADVLQALRQEKVFCALKKIDCKVAPKAAPKIQTVKEKRDFTLSQDNASMLDTWQQQLENGPLKKRLKAFLKHHQHS